jgi:hypothetical protein
MRNKRNRREAGHCGAKDLLPGSEAQTPASKRFAVTVGSAGARVHTATGTDQYPAQAPPRHSVSKGVHHSDHQGVGKITADWSALVITENLFDRSRGSGKCGRGEVER